MPKNNQAPNLRETIEDFLHSNTLPAITTKLILAVLGLGAIVFVGALAPNIFSATKHYSKRPVKYSEKQLQKSIYNLKRRKLIKIIREKNGKTEVKLTNKGRRRIREFMFNEITIPKPAHWDGKWRVVIFDIPVKFNRGREALRAKIKKLGFFQLQKSAWIFPYECEDELLFIAETYNVEKYIEVLTVERLFHAKQLRNKFKL